jgi:hypothetical protein
MEFYTFLKGIVAIGIIIGSIVIFLKRDTFVEESYKGPIFLVFFGLLFIFIAILRLYNANENTNISLIINFLLFKKIAAKGGNEFYFRTIGYSLIVIGFELFVLTLKKKRKEERK